MDQTSADRLEPITARGRTADAEALPYDPTDTPELRHLRDRVRARMEDLGLAQADAHPATALVLAGGGGKGAYQAGALLALHDCGLRHFSVIAGTSVGALNAALFKRLVQSGRRDIVLGVWSDLKFSSVLRGSPWSAIKLLLYFPISILSLNRLPTIDHSRSSALEFELLRPSDLFLLMVRRYFAFVVPAFMGMLAVAALVLGVDYLRGGTDDKAGKALVLAGLTLVPLLCRLLGRRLGLADNAPLRRTVANVYDESLRDREPEVICTLATVPPGLSTAAQASYFSLADAQDRTEVLDLLIQSAALPEIFPMRKLHGNDRVDGGVEDNIPILGLFPRKPRRVFVVYLEERYNVAIARNMNAMVTDPIKALKLYEGQRLDLISQRRGHSWEGPLRTWFWSVELVPIIPSKDLGNLVTGTLNFLQSKARGLMELGYRDALNVLLSWQPR